MERKKLEIGEAQVRKGAMRKGDAPRNPAGGPGQWERGTSGNPSGRKKKVKVDISTVMDAWKKSSGIDWLYFALNYKIPPVLLPRGGEDELSDVEDRELRTLVFKNFWNAADFCRKILGDRLRDEVDSENTKTIDEMMKVGKRARENAKKVINIETKLREANND